MKLSVYVPDDLMESARKVEPDLRPSSVLQEALRNRYVERARRPYVDLDSETRDELRATQRMVLERVREGYMVGYHVGLRFAAELPWEAFENLARLDWDLTEWVSAFDDEDYYFVNASDEERAAGEVLSYGGLLEAAMASEWFPTGEDRVPVGVTGEGFRDALRDVWQGSRTLRGEDSLTAAAPEESVDVVTE